MLKPVQPKQNELEMVTLEQLVPADHLLRQIQRHIDFTFIRDKTSRLYCTDNGRPALDPVVLFKMLFIASQRYGSEIVLRKVAMGNHIAPNMTCGNATLIK